MAEADRAGAEIWRLPADQTLLLAELSPSVQMVWGEPLSVHHDLYRTIGSWHEGEPFHSKLLEEEQFFSKTISHSQIGSSIVRVKFYLLPKKPCLSSLIDFELHRWKHSSQKLQELQSSLRVTGSLAKLTNPLTVKVNANSNHSCSQISISKNFQNY